MKTERLRVSLIVFVFFLITNAKAEITENFGAGQNQFSIVFVPIGNPGNAPDTTGSPNPVGSVGYSFHIAKFATSRDLINKANVNGNLGITLYDMVGFGIPTGNQPNRPATGVSWNEAARFVNWLNVSKGYSPAYKFVTQPGQSGYSPNEDIQLWQVGDAGFNPANPVRNIRARYFLPSVDEWYKAAYYDPNKNDGAGGYWNFPTGSDAAPIAVSGGTTAGTAVYGQPFSQGPANIDNAGGLSPYDVMGLGGNVWEREETSFDLSSDDPLSNRGFRGGRWHDSSLNLSSSIRLSASPSEEGNRVGFRVACDITTTASWVQWSSANGGNDHWYKPVHTPGGISWFEAQEEAEAHGAHLATIASAAENNFVFSLIVDLKYWNMTACCSNGPWLGGYRLPGSPNPASGWVWVTGDPFTYTNWYPTEPNNQSGTQDRLGFFGVPVNSPSLTWHDGNGNSTSIRGYVMERATFPKPLFSPLVYHGGWTGDKDKTDQGKVVAREGNGPRFLTYDNLINTAQGINGILFDIQNLPDTGNLSIEDFEFQVSPTGAFDGGANPPANWQSAPAPSSITVTPGTPDRVLIQWPDQSIMNRWLRITVKATPNTGLAAPETYYIGHLLGETTGPDNGMFTVSFADITPIRAEVGQTVDASSITDIDKNGTVSFADISAMRGNVGSQLTQISVP